MNNGLWKNDDTWMFGNISLSRHIAMIAMDSSGLDSSRDWATRDKIIQAIHERLSHVIDSAIENSVYALACKSMAAQIVHPKLTGSELAKMQLSGPRQ